MNARIPVLAMLFAVSTSAFGDNLIVSLTPSKQHFAQGGAPLFQISIQAVSKPQKVLKFQTRGDLKDTYVHLLITESNKEVELPVFISDPGPIDETDYVELAPGEQLKFAHNGFPLAVSKLPAGTYSVRVSLQPDWSADPIWSNTVTLNVTKHGS